MPDGQRTRLPPAQEEAAAVQEENVQAARALDCVVHAGQPQSQLAAAARNQQQHEEAAAGYSPIPAGAFVLCIFDVDAGSQVETNVKAANMHGVPMCVAKVRGAPPQVRTRRGVGPIF